MTVASVGQGVRTELDEVLATTRSAFMTVGLFSLFINLLMLTAPIYMLQVYNRVLSSGSHETLVFLTIMAAFAILIMCVLDTVRSSMTVRIGCWLNERLSPVYMAAGVRARLKGDTSGGQAFHDINSIQGFIANQGLTAFFDAPWVPVFIAVIWLLHPWLGMLALVSAILLLILTFANDYATRKHVSIASRTQIEATRLADTTIRNSDVVRAMGFLPALVGRWQNANVGSVDSMRRAGEAGGIVMALTKFVRSFVQIGILGLGAFLVLRHELTPGGMIAASIMLGRALAPVELAIGAWKQLMLSRLAYQRLKSQLEEHPPEPPRTRLPEPAGRIHVDGLTYVVPGTTQVLLGHVSFKVEPGEALAVIGPSGAGKSTLCRMLAGLMQPAAGGVRFDGSDIRHWDPDQLGRHIGYLPQDIELFDGTVGENIGRMGASRDEDIVEAAMVARAHEVIQRLPNGYDTRLGAGGLQLSGGQRQRVGLARAVFGRPKLLILDEPNANLDQPGEIALNEAIESLKANGCALVIVGHRPSTLAAADKVIFLQDGVVALSGPRDEVLERLSGGQAGPSAGHGSPAPDEGNRGERAVQHSPRRVEGGRIAMKEAHPGPAGDSVPGGEGDQERRVPTPGARVPDTGDGPGASAAAEKARASGKTPEAGSEQRVTASAPEGGERASPGEASVAGDATATPPARAAEGLGAARSASLATSAAGPRKEEVKAGDEQRDAAGEEKAPDEQRDAKGDEKTRDEQGNAPGEEKACGEQCDATGEQKARDEQADTKTSEMARDEQRDAESCDGKVRPPPGSGGAGEQDAACNRPDAANPKNGAGAGDVSECRPCLPAFASAGGTGHAMNGVST